MAQIDGGVVAQQAARLGGDGWAFTARQLYYAACGAVEAPETPMSNGQIGCGVALLVFGVVFSAIYSYYMVPAALIGMVVIGMGLQRRKFERNRPWTRALAMSWMDFERQFVQPLRAHGATVPEGLLIHADVPEASTATLPPLPSGCSRLVVCDTRETAILVQANLEHAGVDAAAIDLATLPERLEGMTVVTLHDCDKDGCALPLRVRERGPAAVVDAGMRPAQILGRVQLIESAPVVVPAELATLLGPDEISWLAGGRRLEIAVVASERLMRAVAAAFEDAAESTGVQLAPQRFFDDVEGASGVALAQQPAS